VDAAVRFLAARAASAAPAIGEAAGGAVVAVDAAVGLGATVTLVGAVIALPELLIAVAVVAVVVGGVLFFVAGANPPRAAPQPQTQTTPAPQRLPTPGPGPEPIPIPAPPTTTPTPSKHQYLYHYTDGLGLAGILSSEEILASTAHATFGQGQYFTDLPPAGLLTSKEYSVALFRSANVESKVTDWVEIDVQGLPVERVADIYKSKIALSRRGAVEGYGIWLVRNNAPLDVHGRIVGSGTTTFASP